MATLLEKIKTHEAKVAVIGIGYVGLPLVRRDGQGRLPHHRLRQARVQGEAGQRRQDLHRRHLRRGARAAGLRRASSTRSTDPKVLGEADVVVICVPTPLNKTKEPDNGFIMMAAEALKPHLHKDMLIVLESTTFPGFTREILLPKLHGVGAQGRRGLLPLLLARARRSGQREVSDQEHAEGRRRHDAALPRGDPGDVQPRHRQPGAGVVDRRGRDGASSSRTPSARSTSASSTKWRSCATSSA